MTSEQRIQINKDEVHAAVQQYFGENDGVAPIIESLSFLLTSLIGDKDNDWNKSFLSETVNHTTTLIAFLAKIYQLQSKIDELEFWPEGEPVKKQMARTC